LSSSALNFSLAKLKGLPKSLLPVCGKPLISHWIETADSLPEIDEIVVVTNNHFFKLFTQWKSNLKSDKEGFVFNLFVYFYQLRGHSDTTCHSKAGVSNLKLLARLKVRSRVQHHMFFEFCVKNQINVLAKIS